MLLDQRVDHFYCCPRRRLHPDAVDDSCPTCLAQKYTFLYSKLLTELANKQPTTYTISFVNNDTRICQLTDSPFSPITECNFTIYLLTQIYVDAIQGAFFGWEWGGNPLFEESISEFQLPFHGDSSEPNPVVIVSLFSLTNLPIQNVFDKSFWWSLSTHLL